MDLEWLGFYGNAKAVLPVGQHEEPDFKLHYMSDRWQHYEQDYWQRYAPDHGQCYAQDHGQCYAQGHPLRHCAAGPSGRQTDDTDT